MKRERLLISAALCLSAAAHVFAAEPDDGPYTFKQTELTKAATPPAVFVAFMGDHRTPATSGDWGAWADKGKNDRPHQPDDHTGTDGRRDIASVYYPAIGPYDMSDPDVAEYHCQLLKMAGVDGISFNLSFYDRDPWRQRSMRVYVDVMHRYGLKGMVRFENKFFSKFYPDPKEALAQSCRDMDAWLKMLEPVQYRIAGRPVFMLFTFVLTPEELAAWKDKYPADGRPLLVTYGANPKWKGIVEGRFGWTSDAPLHTTSAPYVKYVDFEMMKKNERTDRAKNAELLENGTIDFFMPGVSPGFDDVGCWGWGGGPRKVERENGETYTYRWEHLLKTNLTTAFIPTFNDWCEGTTIEPSVDYGTKYLDLTRHYTALFKHTPEPRSDLNIPIWIYKVRKSTSDVAALKDMAAASAQIRSGNYQQAQKLTKPWAEKLHVEQLTVWDTQR